MDGALTGGFADPARDAAQAFRAVLDAMARPGRIVALGGAAAPGGVSTAAAVVLLTLVDRETPLWWRGAAELDRWIAFHCAAPRAASRMAAQFAYGSADALLPLGDWAMGTEDYPDRSTTLIAEVPALTDGAPLRLTGPGIEDSAVAAPVLPEGFAAERAGLRALYPLGLDIILTAGSDAMALPRSTHLEG